MADLISENTSNKPIKLFLTGILFLAVGPGLYFLGMNYAWSHPDFALFKSNSFIYQYAMFAIFIAPVLGVGLIVYSMFNGLLNLFKRIGK